MNYSPDGFNALHLEVDRQGGALLPDVCSPQSIEFRIKDGYIKNDKQKRVTCGCGNLSRFVLPYKGEDKDKKASFVTFCAVCDSGGAWPRTCKAVYEADPGADPRNKDLEEE